MINKLSPRAREAKMHKILSRMQRDAEKLKELNYLFSDRDTHITLFDHSASGKHIVEMSDREIKDIIVGFLY